MRSWAFVSVALVALVVAASFPAQPSGRDTPRGATTIGEWWFDPTRGAVCWDGRGSLFWFVIDLDGDHHTGFSSQYRRMGDVGNYTVHSTWDDYGGTSLIDETGTRASLLSETVIRPPYPHVRFTVLGLQSEWAHPFVTERTPPTNWILGLSDDDGTRALPITRPFWVSLDRGGTWTEYDPAAYAGPTGDCIEDLPQLAAEVDFDPDTVNPKSHGRWVTVYIELPAAYDPRDIDAATIRLNDAVAPVLDPKYGFVSDPAGYIIDHDGDGILERMVKFDRAAVVAVLPPGTNPVRVTGSLVTGATFEGLSDPVRLLAKS